MPSIYDVAAKLDTQGITAPARQMGANIAIAEQTAREAPERFEREKLGWERQDEQYQQQQQEAQYAKMMDQANRIISVAQTPQSLIRGLRQQLGDAINNPFWQSFMVEAANVGTDVDKLNALKTDYFAIADKLKSQLETAQEADKQRLMTERSKMEQGEQTKRTEAEIGSREKIAVWNNMTDRYVSKEATRRAEMRAQKESGNVDDYMDAYDRATKFVNQNYFDEDGKALPEAPFARGDGSFSQSALMATIDKEAEKILEQAGATTDTKAGSLGRGPEGRAISGKKPRFSIMGN